MKNYLIAFAALSVTCVAQAQATDFNFTFTDNAVASKTAGTSSGDASVFSGYGSLQANSDGMGAYTVTGGDFVLNGASGVWDIDTSDTNKLFIGKGPYLNGTGLTFQNFPDGYINIFDAGSSTSKSAGGAGKSKAGNYSFTYAKESGDGMGTFTLTQAPAPAAAIPFALGLLRRRKRPVLAP